MSNSHNSHETRHAIEAGIGAAVEMAKQAGKLQSAVGQQAYHHITQNTHHHAAKAGAMAVQAVVRVAPIVATTVVAAAPVALAVTLAGGAIYGAYQLWQWFDS